MAGREKLLGAIGVVTTGLGLALLLVPGLIGTLGPIGLVIEAVDAFDGKILVLLAGLGVTAYVVLVARSRPAPETAGTRSAAQRRFERAGANPPEAVTAEPRAVSASTVDGSFEAAVEHGGAALHDARAQLTTAAVGACAVATGQSREAARDAVARGTWTDDPVAALFLMVDDTGGCNSFTRQSLLSAEPSPPLGARLRLWLTPRRERRRRIEATVAAIERLEGTA